MVNKQQLAKRPGRPKSKEKAAAIRGAAMKLFMSEGMERTSMDAIASAAGVSKQTVYSHFKNKDELFRACVTSKIELYSLNVSQFPRGDDLDELLRHIGKQYLTLLSDTGVIQMFRLMVSQADTRSDTVRSFHEAGPDMTTRNIAEIFAKHLPGSANQSELATQATTEYLALIRNDYFLDMLLGVRNNIPTDEMNTHIEHCIAQIHTLYKFEER